MKCCCTYITGQLKDPHCMHCSRAWSHTFVMQHADPKWTAGPFREHVGRVLREKERALLPYTQRTAQLKTQIAELNRQIDSLPRIGRLGRTPALRHKNQGRIAEVSEARSQLLARASALRQECELYSCESKKERRQPFQHIVCKCPSSECRGYVERRGDAFECGTCASAVCEHCHALMTPSHECDKHDLASVKLIASETRPCPKCRVPIYKAGGCDQMYCVMCHVAFSWKTGEVETGAIHNPHYYEWLAQTAQTRDVAAACEHAPTAATIAAAMMSRPGCGYAVRNQVLALIQKAVHMEQVVLPALCEDRIRDNLDLRVAYLLGEITDEQWAGRLAHREFRRMKTRATADVCRTAVTVLKDIAWRCANESGPGGVEACLDEARAFAEYYANALEQVSRVHGGRVFKVVPVDLL